MPWVSPRNGPVPRDTWVRSDRAYWISRRTVDGFVSRIPVLPGCHPRHLPAWLTDHAPGRFRFATTDELCLAHLAEACRWESTHPEAALSDSRRPDVWRWVAAGCDYEQARWRMAFASVESASVPSVWSCSRLIHARLVWTPYPDA